MSRPRSALVVGATGSVGQRVLRYLLRGSSYSRIGEYGRYLSDKRELALEGISRTALRRLEQKIIDFETLQDGEWTIEEWDVIYMVLGTSATAAVGSRETFDRINRTFVLKAAHAARRSDGGYQRLVYLSAAGASLHSLAPYLQSRGLTEAGLASIGFDEVLVVRPGQCKHPEAREGITSRQATGSSTGWLRNTIDSLVAPDKIEVSVLAVSVAIAGQLGSDAVRRLIPRGSRLQTRGNEVTVIDNNGASQLGHKAKAARVIADWWC
ncbi:Protein fmp52, mitochondrial [Tulasnella sp. 330]|nr:Protein fmp52, mitochondrial [Tulasnella sp. 330]